MGLEKLEERVGPSSLVIYSGLYQAGGFGYGDENKSGNRVHYEKVYKGPSLVL